VPEGSLEDIAEAVRNAAPKARKTVCQKWPEMPEKPVNKAYFGCSLLKTQ